MSGLIIRTNMMALNAHRNTRATGGESYSASRRLASGHRINSAADDVAGVAISESMQTQMRGLDQARRNANDGVALATTMDGAMQGITDMLIRARELTIQGLNDTNTDVNRESIAAEIEHLFAEINSQAQNTQFGSLPLLNVAGAEPSVPPGAASHADAMLHIQSGANSSDGMFIERFNITPENVLNPLDSDMVGGAPAPGNHVDWTVTLSPTEVGTRWLEAIDNAIDSINSFRARVGAQVNRLSHVDNYNAVAHTNISDANSRVMDANMAQEMMGFTLANILQQSGLAMMAQSNTVGETALQLMRS